MSRRQYLLLAGLASTGIAACSNDQPSSLSPSRDPQESSLAPSLNRDGDSEKGGWVITMTNGTAGNEALVFPRDGRGNLGNPVHYPTGGTGSGGGLGNQAGVVADQDVGFIYAVNAGSNSISVFRRSGADLVHRQTIASGGIQPISLAIREHRLYVLNDGGSANVVGFRVGEHGMLHPLSGATYPLSTAIPDAAQVGISPDGRTLVVTEKATHNLVLFPIRSGGRLGQPVVQRSQGNTPFGFAFDDRGTLVVSEAFGGAPNGSALSSYRGDASGFAVVSASVGTTQTAACWVVVTKNNRFAYTSNTNSGSISGYRLRRDGTLTLLTPDGRTGVTGNGPIDLAITENGRLLFSLNGRDGSISGFRVGREGDLVPVSTTVGLPAGANGLIAF